MKEKTYKITDLLSLAVLALFAVALLLVLLIGGRVYRDLVASGKESYQSRTAVQYIATRVRQAREVDVEDFAGSDALVIREEVGGRVYLTRIYCCDGWLRELFSAETAQLKPEDGEKILEAEDLTFSLEDGLLTVVIDSETVLLHLRSGEEVVP